MQNQVTFQAPTRCDSSGGSNRSGDPDIRRRIRLVVAATLPILAAPIGAFADPEFSIETGNFYEAVAFPPDEEVDSEFIETDKSWGAAKIAAENSMFDGIAGHLATITSAEENGFVSALRSQLPGICPENCVYLTEVEEPGDDPFNSELWIGGSQGASASTPGDNWTWENGEGPIPGTNPVNPADAYANWRSGESGQVEPNDGDGTENGDEDFLALGWGGICPDEDSDAPQCVWNDNQTSLFAIHGYVVEYEYTPPDTVDDSVNATSGILKKIKVLENDTLQPDRAPNTLTIDPAETEFSDCGIPIEVDDDGVRIRYNPPSDFVTGTVECPTDEFDYRVTDENGAYDIATVQVTVLADEAEVDEENTAFSNQAQNPAPNSVNPLTGGYQQVLDGGKVKISCCRVLDTREGAGDGGKKFGDYLPDDFDLGSAIADTWTNPSCAGMPEVAPGTAILKPWHRGVPESKGVDRAVPAIAREHDLGVCVIEADATSKGVAFTAEQAKNLLGYKLDYTVPSVDYRPLTGGVSLDPVEVDASEVIPWSAETDESKSGKRFSDNLMVVNLWHDRKHNDSKPYLSRLAASLKESIEAVKLEGCVDNSAGFLDDLLGYVDDAKKQLGKKGDATTGIEALDDATRLALLIGPEAPASDPYGTCISNPNPQGLFVGRMMALRFAMCSELLHATSNASTLPAPGDPDGCNCVIASDIEAELPELPGFPPAACPDPSL